MAHFTTTPLPIPVLSDYLFEADLVVSIIPPQTFTCVPTRDQTVQLNWSKDVNTDDTINDLYTEIYRSTDLVTWELVITRQWLNYDYYTDTDVDVSQNYYYKIRFVRLTSTVVTTASNFTSPCGVKAVTKLGFEPRDQFSNKFFQYLQQALPGTRIYDRTNAATFSTDTFQLWQTSCKILEGFDMYLDSSLTHSEPADSTALYAKRNVSFMVDKKHVKLTSIDDQAAMGEVMQVSSYLIHTFLQTYAQQYLKLYEQYFQIVTNSFIDTPQLYTKGLKPLVSTQKEILTADLWYSFGQLLNLQPLKSQETEQGIVRYKEMLQNSFTNQDSSSKKQSILDACTDTLGITTQYLLEYYKQHWFKSDREAKVYVAPLAADTYAATITTPTANTDLDYALVDNSYWISIVYNHTILEFDGTSNPEPLPIDGLTFYYDDINYPNLVVGITDVDVNLPYSRLITMYCQPVTASTYATAANIKDYCATLVNITALTTITDSLGSTGTGLINDLTGHTGELLKVQTRLVSWDDTELHMYNKLFKLEDTKTLLTGQYDSTFSCALSITDSTIPMLPATNNTFAFPETAEQIQWGRQEPNSLLLAKDTNATGISYYLRGSTYPSPELPIELSGTKHVLFKIPLTTVNSVLLKKAILNLFVNTSSQAGYLKLYRIRKIYDESNVCWSFSDKETIGKGYFLNALTSEYESISTDTAWTTNSWTVTNTNNAKFLKDIYIPKVDIDSPAQVSVNITDVIQDVYKYETSRQDLGDDPENLNECGFMITMENYSDKSFMSIQGDTDIDSKQPNITWEFINSGFYEVPVDASTFLFLDGTTRYDQLLVRQSVREPISYNITVNERIRGASIKFNSASTITTIVSPPAEFAVGKTIYGATSTAYGIIEAIDDITISVQINFSNFVVGELLSVLDYETAPASSVIATVADSTELYIKLSRTPILDSTFTVYHSTIAPTVAATPPGSYPSYAEWTEAGSGILPVFIAAVPGGTFENDFVTQDANDPTIIYLNTDKTLANIGDVFITYDYLYEYVLLGKVTADANYITDIEACNRLNNGIFSQRENDFKYQSELMLPEPQAFDTNPDISGDTTIDEYSDFNLEQLGNAVANVRRSNGLVDIFKYDIIGKTYRFGQAYHTFFKRK